MSDFYNSAVIPDMLATAADYTAYTQGDPPDNINPLLRSCTTMVLDATSGSYYDADPLTGLATDPVIAKALTNATCAQAAAWDALGINPLTGGVLVAGVKTAKGIGTGRISYGDVAQAAAARAAAATDLVPDALRILLNANLIGIEPWTYG